jgi:AcrR family transcriptional regulator
MGETMAKTKDETLFEAALDLAAQKGWGRTTLSDIAEAAGMPLAELYRQFRSKRALLVAFSRMIDEEVLANVDPDLAGEPARDRLFSILMQRFDALGPYKAGLSAVARDESCDPCALLCGAPHLARSMAWTLEAAGIGSAGLGGALRVKGLAAIYLITLGVWFRDETEDMSRTMAALDRSLRRVDTLLATLKGRCPGPAPEPAAP